MNLKVVLQIAAACAALCCSVMALAQQPADAMNGSWTVTFTVQAQTVSGEMTFQAQGEKLSGTVETEHTGRGTLKGGAWSEAKLSGIYVFERHQAIAIAGEFREGKLAGVFRTEGMDGRWEAVCAAAQP